MVAALTAASSVANVTDGYAIPRRAHPCSAAARRRETWPGVRSRACRRSPSHPGVRCNGAGGAASARPSACTPTATSPSASMLSQQMMRPASARHPTPANDTLVHRESSRVASAASMRLLLKLLERCLAARPEWWRRSRSASPIARAPCSDVVASLTGGKLAADVLDALADRRSIAAPADHPERLAHRPDLSRRCQDGL